MSKNKIDISENKDIKPKSFTLFDNETGQSFEVPVLVGSDGPKVLDIRNLFKETGMFTYDPGFTSTADIFIHLNFLIATSGFKNGLFQIKVDIAI